MTLKDYYVGLLNAAKKEAKKGHYKQLDEAIKELEDFAIFFPKPGEFRVDRKKSKEVAAAINDGKAIDGFLYEPTYSIISTHYHDKNNNIVTGFDDIVGWNCHGERIK